MLFYCLEEKLNLPTVFVERGNGLCRQRKIMGEKFVELTRRCISVTDQAQLRRAPFVSRVISQPSPGKQFE